MYVCPWGEKHRDKAARDAEVDGEKKQAANHEKIQVLPTHQGYRPQMIK